MKIVQCDGVLSLTQLPVHDFRVGFQIFNKFDNDVFLIFIRRYLFLSGIGEKFACPKSIKGSIFSRYQFPVQKEGLELWKNVIFRNAGQISHDIPTRLLVLITMKCRVPDFILFDFMENFRFTFCPKRSRIATNFRKKVPRILNVSKGELKMNLFCFASKNAKNIQIGIENQLWAVATLLNQQSMAARATKARKYLKPGDYGLLYCNPLHSFTTPFIVRSHADPHRAVTSVWPEGWALPFKIQTLGNLTKQITAEEAEKRWHIVKNRMEKINRRGGVSAAMNMTGTTVFVPVDISQEDWAQICHDLCV